MTERQILRCIRRWQSRLLLDHWEIVVDFDHPPQSFGSTAEIRRQSDYERAEIRLAANWREWTVDRAGLAEEPDEIVRPGSLDRTIAHELIHLILADLEHAGKTEVGELPMAVERRHENELEHQLERATERLARVLVAAYDR